MFRDRITAGKLLAEKLKKIKFSNGIVLAIPRGGVPVGKIIAETLQIPLDIILIKKIGHPLNKEYAIGAASLDEYFIIPHEDVSDQYIQDELKEVRNKLLKMKEKYKGDHISQSIFNKSVILVDDGIATGNTMLQTIAIVKKSKPHRIIVAVPVMPKNKATLINKEVDRVVTLTEAEDFYGISSFYEYFEQLTDEAVIKYLQPTLSTKENHQR